MRAPSSCRPCWPPQSRRSSPDLRSLLGIAVGVETICRLSLVVPKAVHKAGFHPTAVFGAMAAAAGVGAALRLEPARLANALGIAGSMASGIIEYLADGSSTKRMHPGWAAQSGLRAALLARAGFTGPRTVFEGTHGLFNGFAHTREGNYGRATRRLRRALGRRETLAFKPYPCGTMVQPYIDCALRLRVRGHRGRRHRGDRLRGRRGHGASTVGAARRQAAPAQRLRRQVRYTLLHRHRPRARAASGSTPSPTPPSPIRPCARWRPRSATDRSRQPLPPRLHRPYPRDACATAAVSRSASHTCAAGAHAPLTRAEIEAKFAVNARSRRLDAGPDRCGAHACKVHLACGSHRSRGFARVV